MPDQDLSPKVSKEKRNQPLLIVLSGPSGVGKDTVINRMKGLGRPFHYVVTATTRPRRSGEKDGVDYHFLSREEFQRLLEDNEFVEWAEVYGHHYGVPRNEITSALGQGKDVIVKVDVQGAATLKKLVPQAVFIFLIPPSRTELEKRLRKRHSESEADLAMRLRKAEEEMSKASLFDHVIINHEDRIDEVVSQIEAIIAAEKRRPERGKPDL
jgi:guanylate kinase